MGVTGACPGITSDVEAIDEEGAALLNRLNGDGRIAGPPPDTTKGLGLVAFCVRLGSDELAVGGTTPIVGAAGVKEGASEDAKGPNELARIAALKSGPGKLQEKLLERLVRLRRVAGPRISAVSCQRTPIA